VNRRTVSPRRTSSPAARTASRRGIPLTRTPLALSRSRIVTPWSRLQAVYGHSANGCRAFTRCLYR
jgi:hypothetical protein